MPTPSLLATYGEESSLTISGVYTKKIPKYIIRAPTNVRNDCTILLQNIVNEYDTSAKMTSKSIPVLVKLLTCKTEKKIVPSTNSAPKNKVLRYNQNFSFFLNQLCMLSIICHLLSSCMSLSCNKMLRPPY